MLSFSHTIHIHTLHICCTYWHFLLWVLWWGLISKALERRNASFLSPLKFSLVQDPTWVHFWSPFAFLSLKFHLSDKLQACGKQTTSPAIYCCSSQNLHFKNPLKHEVLPTCWEFFFFGQKCLECTKLPAGFVNTPKILQLVSSKALYSWPHDTGNSMWGGNCWWHKYCMGLFWGQQQPTYFFLTRGENLQKISVRNT